MEKRRGRGGSGSSSSSTLASEVYEQLRHDIMTGEIKPEEKLRIDALKELYGAGSSPIREALNRLTAEGMVVQHDQRGFQVPPVSIEDLNDLTQARTLLYEVTLREAIARGDMQWEEAIVVAFHRLLRTPAYLDEESKVENPAWSNLHREFHRSLVSACKSRWLMGFMDTLFDLADRYRFLSMRSSSRTNQQLIEGHRVLMDAVIDRDVDRAVELIKAHISQTVAEASRHSTSHGDS